MTAAAPSTPSAPLPRWEGWRYVLPLFLASRVLLYVAAVAAPYLLAPQVFSTGLAHETDASQYWCRWDAGWYATIAESGYAYDPETTSSVAFFPLFPMLMRGLAWAGMPAWGAGMLLANIATLVLLFVFYRWLRREFEPPAVAEAATALLAFCPQSCWFIIGYTEPLFLLTAVAALSAARQGRWTGAALWALAHGLTRSNGITLALPLLCIAWPELRQMWATGSFRAMLRPAVAIVGAWFGHAAYLAYLWAEFGTWQANQITSKAGWGVQMVFDAEHLRQKIPGIGLHLFRHPVLRSEWIVWSWFLALAATVFSAIALREKRQPLFWFAALAAFWSLFLLTSECNWLTGSMGRFAAGLFPVPVAMALFAQDRPWARPCFFALNAGLAVLNIALVFAGYHIV